MAGSTAQIYQSLFANLAIAAAKGVAAVFTGSGSMLAEAIHSAADCVNQVLLLIGVKATQKPPDAQHPFGYGRVAYFWSFMVALLLFSGGGVFSIYEGLHKWAHPEPVEHVWAGVAILLFSLVLEGGATWSNYKEMKKRSGGMPILRYLRETKDSDLVVLFGENSAASLGLAVALAALGLASSTGDPRWDAVGGIVIGVVLIGVAVFLAKEVQSLLVGESADTGITESARRLAQEHPSIRRALEILTMQQGPGEVIVALKLDFEPGLDVPTLYRAINEYEDRLRAERPEIRWCFIEPGDVVRRR